MSTSERLRRVERELCGARRLRAWLVVWTVLAVARLVATFVRNERVVGAQARRDVVVRATAFILEDDSGRTRAVLDMLQGGPALSLTDDGGRRRVVLGTNATRGSGLILYDYKEVERASLSLHPDGESQMALGGENGELQVLLRVNKDEGFSGLTLADENGTGRLRNIHSPMRNIVCARESPCSPQRDARPAVRRPASTQSEINSATDVSTRKEIVTRTSAS